MASAEGSRMEVWKELFEWHEENIVCSDEAKVILSTI